MKIDNVNFMEADSFKIINENNKNEDDPNKNFTDNNFNFKA